MLLIKRVEDLKLQLEIFALETNQQTKLRR